VTGKLEKASRDGVVARPEPRRLDMGEIARRAGVARSTVSYALSGKRTISHRTRRRILKVVEDLGYRPNASAQALAAGRSRTLGVAIPPAEQRLIETQLSLVAFLSQLASSHDLDLLLSPCSDARDRAFQRMLSGRRVDGVLLMEVRMRDDRVLALRRSGLPHVIVGRPGDPAGLFWVDFDYGGLVERCVEHLAALGHRRVALVNRSAESLASGYGPAQRSLAAFRAAAKRRGVVARPFCCSYDSAGGEGAMTEILAEPAPITAAVVVNESALPGIARALELARMQVPRDFSVMGVVAKRWADDFRPEMTGAIVSHADLARTAFDMLIERIANPGAPARHALLSPPITVRASTGPAPVRREKQRRRG
jgi:DNA-binding LacI/PurR family transcriptional regulator